MTTVLAIDVGTSAVKAAVVADGEVLGVAEVAHPLSTPRPGWSEQHPHDWWTATRRAVAELLGDPLVDRGAIAAVAVTGQMQDLVPIDADGRPVRPAILYSDVRAVTEHAELVEEIGADRWADAVGAIPDASNVAAKWRWMRRHEPAHAEATTTVLFGAHSYVVALLTGQRVCDPTTAATTGLYELGAATWWDEITAAIGIPLPTIVPATMIAERLRTDAAEQLGLPDGLPVVHANGDAVATTVGVIGREFRRPYAYLGTSGWVAVASPTPPVGEGVIVLPGLDDDHWVGAAPMPTAGGALDWVRRMLVDATDDEGSASDQDGPDDNTDSAEHSHPDDLGPGLDAIAGDVSAAAEGVLFLPHLDGARIPLAAPDAAGVLIGVRRSTSRATIAAAALEGVAHAVRQLAEVVAPGAPDLVVCGGAARSAALRQVIAEVCAVPVLHRSADHAAVLGAATAAMIALGGVARPPATLDAPVSPRPDRVQIHRRSAVVFDDLLPTMQRLLTRLVEIRSADGPASSDPADRPDA